MCECVHMSACTHAHLFMWRRGLMISFDTTPALVQQDSSCWSDLDQWLACSNVQHWHRFADLNKPLMKGIPSGCVALLWTSHHFPLSLQWGQRKVVHARTKVCASGEPSPKLCHVRYTRGLLSTGKRLCYTRMAPQNLCSAAAAGLLMQADFCISPQ